MSILLSSIIAIMALILGRVLFEKWFNHVSIYSLSWWMFIVLYEVKLIKYPEIKGEVWLILLLTFIGFISGTLTVFYAQKSVGKSKIDFSEISIDSNFFQKKNIRILKYLLIFTSLIGFLSALQNWVVLINKFGSLETVLLRANLIYRMRIAGEIEGIIPYLHSVSYSGVMIGGIYMAIKNKFSMIAFLPLLAVILKDIASIGRGGIFVGFLLFAISFILFRYAILKNSSINRSVNRRNLIISISIILVVVIGSLSLVKSIRGSFESFEGQTAALNKLKDIPVLSPSIYMYFSSNIGVFSKYYDLQRENPMFGENTFLPVYNVLSKFNVVKHPNTYPPGYKIPMWTNAATYLRDIHADFGPVGLFFIPFFLSMLATIFWFKFYESGKLIPFVFLTYIYLIISFSVFYMITRAAFWILSFMFLIIVVSFLEKHIRN